MRTITLYRISLKDLGYRVTLVPAIPKYSSDRENKELPRICACPTITGCLDSLQLGWNPYYQEINDKINLDPSGIDLYLYKANVPIDNVIQPTVHDVGDSFITGEMWIIDSQVFTLETKYHLSKHMSFPNSALSRYEMRREGIENAIADRYCSIKVYGDINQFSYIELDLSREDMAMDYYSNNNDAYCPNFIEVNNND